jgi:hypothetical protein
MNPNMPNSRYWSVDELIGDHHQSRGIAAGKSVYRYAADSKS